MPHPSHHPLGLTSRIVLLSAFFLSGATALTFEVVWTRLILLSVGATAAAVGIVLGAFMGGMAVGSALSGRPSVARRDPVLLFAWLEGWIGLYGLASPYLLQWVGVVPAWSRVACALVLLLPATTAMGASLPIVTRALASPTGRPAAIVGRLYAINTAGAVLGPLLAVFALFPSLGLSRTVFVASTMDLLIFAVLVVGRRFSSATGIVPTGVHRGRRPANVLLGAMAVSGAAAMVYEVAWSRTLSLVYGSSIYGVAIMLSTYLAGLACGSWLVSLVLRRRETRFTYRVPAWLLVGAGGTAFVSLLVAERLPLLFLELYRMAPERDLTLFATQFATSAMLMLPSTLCLGAMLPAVTGALPRSGMDESEPGVSVSRLYSANLLGAAGGATLAAGVLIGSIGIDLSVRLASLLALTAAAWLAVRDTERRSALSPLSACMAGGLIVLALDPASDRLLRTFGLYVAPQNPSRERDGLRELIDAHKLLYYRDGPAATVAVQKIGQFYLLKINGKTDASNGPGDLATELLLGHLPLMATDADRVAVIGWGSGITTGAVLTHDVASVDAYEIEPAVIEASRFFEPWNGRALDDSRLTMIVGDARSELRHVEEDYDIIISEPSNPWITGVSNLFTQDFFRLTASKLRPGGILCQWFHLYGMSEESIRTMVATFRSVYPQTLVFGDRDLILLGSEEPIRFSLPRMEHLFEQPDIAKSLATARIEYPADLLAELRLDSHGAAELSRSARFNTDDNLLLELNAPRSLYRDRIDAIQRELARHAPRVPDLVTGAGSDAAVLLEVAASHFTAGRKDAALRACRRSLELENSFEGQKLLGQTLHRLGRHAEARIAFHEALEQGGDPQARRFVEALLRSVESASSEPTS